MRLQLAFVIAVFQAMLVGLARAGVPFDLVDYNTKPTYSEKNYRELNFQEKVSIAYKPSVEVENGCDMYAAFFGVKNGRAQISGGLQGMDADDYCRNKNIGTRQMYANYNYTEHGHLAIVHAMFFPKQANKGSIFKLERGGARYLWQAFVTVFNATQQTKSFEDLKPVFIAWSINLIDGDPVEADFHKLSWDKLNAAQKVGETHVKLKMYYNGDSTISHLGLTGHDGAWIPVIQYSQLEKEVQEYVETEKWTFFEAPFSKAKFSKIIDAVVRMT